MTQRSRFTFAIAVVALAVLAVALVHLWDTSRARGGTSSSAASLPTACENFVQASALFARGGSAELLRISGGQVFDRDPATGSKAILDDLIDSCAAEWSAQAP